MKNSLKMRFSVAFSCIAVSVIIICSLSAYTYEILISRLADYSLSLSELNEFRFQFGELNNVIDEYLESGSVESREKYGDIRTEVTDLCEKINQEYSSGDDDIQSSLAVSVYSTFSKYIQQTDEIINSVDRDKITEKSGKYITPTKFFICSQSRVVATISPTNSNFDSEWLTML